MLGSGAIFLAVTLISIFVENAAYYDLGWYSVQNRLKHARCIIEKKYLLDGHVAAEFCAEYGSISCDCSGHGVGVYRFQCCTREDTSRADRHICLPCDDAPTCDRFTNCAECTTNQDNRPCATCKRGYAIGPGDCSVDEDECEIGNHGCDEHSVCFNTVGSRRCDCKEGYVTVDETNCRRVYCDEEILEGGSVRPSSDDESWATGTYALYSCSRPGDVLLGVSARKCQQTPGAEKGTWDGERPVCVESRPVTEVYFRTSRLENDDYHPVASYPGYSADACGFMCNNCPGYNVITWEEEGVILHDCTIYSVKRDGYSIIVDVNENEKINFTNKVQVDSYTAIRFDDSLNAQTYDDMISLQLGDSLSCFPTGGLSGWIGHKLEDFKLRSCLGMCRAQAFTYFAVQAPDSLCLCGSARPESTVRLKADRCSTGCPEQNQMRCGAQDALNVYKIIDSASLPWCYEGDLEPGSQLYSTNKPMEMCLLICGKRHHYVALTRGGECYCVRGMPDMRQRASPDRCNLACIADPHKTCGGHGYFTMYSTHKAQEWQHRTSLPKNTTEIHVNVNELTGITTLLFKKLPGLKHLTSSRLVLYSSNDIRTPKSEDLSRFEPCGEMRYIENVTRRGENVTLRFFALKLSTLPLYVGSEAERVYVYAHTVVIDTDVNFQFVLQIRAAEILTDLKRNLKIRVSFRARDLFPVGSKLSISMSAYGPEPDFQFLKQSVTCARILRERFSEADAESALTLLQEVITSSSNDQSIKTLQTLAEAYRIELMSIDRKHIHIVPPFTMGYIVERLNIYAEEIIIADANITTLRNKMMDPDFIAYMQNMNAIYDEKAIREAKIGVEDALRELDISKTSYYIAYEEFEDARNRLNNSETKFVGSISQTYQNRNLLMQYVSATVKLGWGLMTADPITFIDGAVEAFQIKPIDSTLASLNEVVKNIDNFIEIAEDIQSKLGNFDDPFEEPNYVFTVKEVAQMPAQKENWRTLCSESKKILDNEDISAIPFASDYGYHLIAFCHRGMAMTDALMGRAEAFRGIVEERTILDMLKKSHEEAVALSQTLEASQEDKESMVIMMEEQASNIATVINDELTAFCQAYFFETYQKCSDRVRPQFGLDLKGIQQKILDVKKLHSEYEPDFSSTSDYIDIKDEEGTTDECKNVTRCPITYFREHRNFSKEVDVDHPDIRRVSGYRVWEIYIYIDGATSRKPKANVRLKISSNGHFKGYSQGTTYNFLTDPFELDYEYNLHTGGVMYRADIHEKARGVVAHVTPFTTWNIVLDDIESADIDLSSVSSITMYFCGDYASLAGRHEDTSGQRQTHLYNNPCYSRVLDIN